MIYGLRRVIRYFLGGDIAGRNQAVCPGDTFVISYATSGQSELASQSAGYSRLALQSSFIGKWTR